MAPNRCNLVLVTSCICLLSQLVNSSSIKKRNAPSPVASIIEEKIKSVPAELFALDKVFLQQIDKTNKVSKYTLQGEETPVYERNNEVDSGKEVVVLSSEEDKLPFKKMKRVYVVLKHTEGKNYVACLAIIRDAAPSDKDAQIIEGKSRVIEWSIFDEHIIHGRHISSLLTIICSASMTANCLFNASVVTAAPDKFVKSPPYKSKSSPNNVKEEVELTPLVSGDGSDPVENYDTFSDLDVNRFEGRGFGDFFSAVGQIGLLPTVLGGASGIICTALAIVGICGHGKGSTDLNIINESGVPLDPNMIQELVGRRKRATDTTTPSIDYPGWKTQFGNPTKGLILAKEEETYFFGFGNCPSQKPDEAALLKSAKTEDVISYYRTVLRTDCLPATSGLINGYVSQGIIKLNDKNIELVADHRFLTQAKLGLPELIMVSGATELSAFSIVFQDHYKRGKSPSAQVGPDGSRKISKSTGFIGEVFLTYLKLARQSARHHVATLSRTAVLNLNTIFTKLAQDEQNLQRCADCVEGKEVNLNDRLYIMGLSLFIKKGLGFDEKEPNIFKAFETFYKGNADKFEKFVNVYS